MKAITIYKASAGTGKTYTLAARYIALLLQDIPASSILAVTFTNKATAEMKQRIIEYLYAIGHSLPEADGVRQTILQFLPAPTPRYPYNQPEFISSQAQKALKSILLDFDHFTVCTIDSFLQALLSGLARDLGYTAHFKVELSDKEVIEKAVDDLMCHITDSPRLRSRVERFIKQRMDDEKGWDVRRQLKALAKELTRETYLRHGSELNDALSCEDKISAYQERLQKDSVTTGEGDARKKLDSLLRKFQNSFEKDRLKYGQDALSWTTNLQNSLNEVHGLKESDYFRQPSNRLANYLSFPDTWAKQRTDTAYAADMAALLSSIMTQAARCASLRNSRRLTLKHLNELSLLDDIHRKVEQIEQENDRFLLAQTPIKLYEVIRQEPTDATFILERAGIRYHHIMIDEFQDTSSLQWENFMPLTEEIIASGGTALLVGDVKQSIYRWRGGDWDILGSIQSDKPRRLGRHFHEKTAQIIPLDKNFRSQETIVRFNLQFFHQASFMLDQLADKLLPDDEDARHTVGRLLAEQGFDEDTIHRLYLTEGYDPDAPDMTRFCARSGGLGHVCLKLYPTGRSLLQETNEQILHDMFTTLFQLHEQGMPFSQMAILVRTHNLTATIVSYLDAHWDEFQSEGQTERPAIVSAEAFLLRASTSVQMIISALRYLNDRTDLISLCYLARHYREDILGCPVTDWTDITSRLGQDSEMLKELLPEAFVQQREALSHYPLYELIEQLVSLLLFAPGSSQRPLTDDAYLFAFLDEAIAYLSDQSSSLDEFLEYWDNTLSLKSIPSSDQSRGIQVVSIHKSKGLQYKTVFLPCCDWDLEKDRTDDLLWCAPSADPYNDIPYIPITPTSVASNSIYNIDYQTEHFKRRIDNLNLLYVAFTRAENNLYVWSKVECQSGGKQPNVPLNTVGQLISYTLDKNADVLQHPADASDPIIYTCGQPFLPSSAESDSPRHYDNRFKLPRRDLFASFAPHSERLVFRQSNQSAEFLQALEGDTDNRRQYIRQGNLLHKIYSEINAADDAPQVLQAFLEQGLIENDRQLQDIRAIIERGWQNEQVRNWFNGTWTLFRECCILSRQPDSRQVVTRRPDRVMTKDGHTVVVDFKFGKPRPDYILQVQTYMQLLSRMGHRSVSGYLWYVYENRIEPVSAPQE